MLLPKKKNGRGGCDINITLWICVPTFQAERIKDGAWPGMYGTYGKTQ